MMKWSRGFTLIELIITISVVGVLATVIIVAVNPVTQLRKSRDVARKSALKEIQTALEQYYADNGHYPLPSNGTNFSGVGGRTCLSDRTCWSTDPTTSFMGADVLSYIKTIPQDPSKPVSVNCSSTSNRLYAYHTNSTGSSYWLFTRLENTADPAIQSGGPNYTSGAISDSSCGSWANYLVTD